MNKIKELKLTKKTGTSDQYYVMGTLSYVPGTEQEYYGIEELNPVRWINLLEPNFDENHFVDFYQNIDVDHQAYAKTHGIFNNDNFLGKVSIKDGNYPPPYTLAQPFVPGYDQNALCRDFKVLEMQFISNAAGDKYTMNITLQKGNGSVPPPVSNFIAIMPIPYSGFNGLVIGIEDLLSPNLTLKFSVSNLDLKHEIGILPVWYNGSYNFDILNTYFHKKGVIELH